MEELLEVAVEAVGAGVEAAGDGSKKGCGCLILSLIFAAGIIYLCYYLS